LERKGGREPNGLGDRDASQQVRREKPAAIGRSRAPLKRQRLLALEAMAERENLESNVLRFLHTVGQLFQNAYFKAAGRGAAPYCLAVTTPRIVAWLVMEVPAVNQKRWASAIAAA